MGCISITDLEVTYHVGVTEAERAQPQRLLLTIVMEADFTAAAATDDLGQTIDYFAVSQRLLKYGARRQWRLIETLATDIATFVLAEYPAARVEVEVKKFVIPQAQHVSVRLSRSRADTPASSLASGNP